MSNWLEENAVEKKWRERFGSPIVVEADEFVDDEFYFTLEKEFVDWFDELLEERDKQQEEHPSAILADVTMEDVICDFIESCGYTFVSLDDYHSSVDGTFSYCKVYFKERQEDDICYRTTTSDLTDEEELEQLLG